ncbi:MAG: hypothetical protein JSU06_00875 [Actinobacteria bacterium]|nr:hypothetical protein [Actinomycetota bacterium]
MSDLAASLAELTSLIEELEAREHGLADSRLRRIGIDLPLWDALWAVDRRPGSSLAALAVATRQSEAQLHGLLDQLLLRGLIVSRRGPELEVGYHTTRQGRATVREGGEIIKRLVREHLADLPDGDRDRLLTVLQAFGPKSATCRYFPSPERDSNS